MLFKFLKYLQPTHYFSLPKNNGELIFPVVDKLPKSVLEQLKKDQNYKSELSEFYDLSWQAIHKGYIGDTKPIKEVSAIPLGDEYYFISKYFSSAWVFYVLVIRILSFNNPFKECYAWYKTRKVKRSDYLKNSIKYDAWNTFKSQLLEDNPKITVIIPTLNRYVYLKDVLRDLEKQDYKNFEVIVVDQSEPFQKDFYKAFDLDLKVIYQKEKALWLARNSAIKNAKGTLIALSEDDVRVRSDWLTQHIKCLDFFKAHISAGVFYPQGSSIPKERSFFTVASQFATGNALLFKDVFRKIGLFDRQFEKQRMGDGEFGLRCYINGFKSISNPFASCIDVKASTGGLRQMGSWDAFRTKKWLAPRPIPSVLYLFRNYFGNKSAKYTLLKTVPLSIMPYQFKKNKVLLVLGVFVSVLILPVILLQVFMSWRLSGKKIKQGTLIESCN